MRTVVVALLAVVLGAGSVRGQELDFAHSFTPCGLTGVYEQDFNGGDFAAPSTVPAGWTYREWGTNVNTVDGLLTDSSGQSNSSTARRFRFDQTPDEAAFGTQRSASDSSDSAVQWIGWGFTNECPGVITGLQVTYAGETWRVSVANRSDGLLFEYSLDATGLANGTWASQHSLDYFNPGGPITNGSLGNVTSATVSGAVTGLWLAPGQKMMIRWSDYDTPVAGREDGIGIDDLTIVPVVLHYGDANGDGVVDLQDFGVLKDAFGTSAGAAWQQGDFNGDGATDLQDFGVLKDHFGHTAGDTGVVAVPEPASGCLLLAAGIAMRQRTRRRG